MSASVAICTPALATQVPVKTVVSATVVGWVRKALAPIEIQVNAHLAVSEDVESLIGRARMGMAFALGGMGSATTNFYNAAYARAGFADAAREVQRLWVSGDRAAAVAAVPEKLVLSAYLIGTESMVCDRIRAYAAAGVDTLRLGPNGSTAAEQIEDLERAVDLVRSATKG